jgi:putative ABC transport system ATP-binding protein
MQTSSQNASLLVEVIDVYHELPMSNDRVHILNGVSFNVRAGEWIALTGPSGSGKSTLLGIVAGLESPVRGVVRVDGVDISRAREGALARFRNSKVGVVFQSFNLIPSLTAQENVEVPLYVHTDARHSARRAREMLERVGMGDRLHHRPNQLSGGQQQRVAIARALVTQPALVVADEPTGNLDSVSGQQVLELFATLRREFNLTLLVATHDPDIAGRADRELHLVDGKLQQPAHAPGVAKPEVVLSLPAANGQGRGAEVRL